MNVLLIYLFVSIKCRKGTEVRALQIWLAAQGL